MIIKQPNPPYRSVLTTQLNHLVSLAKWLCVGLRTKWLWVRVQLHSLKLEISRLLRARSSLTFRPLGFTLKRVCHMIITYSQMHQTDKYSWYSSIIWTVWLNGWVFIYELSGCGFESSWSHLNFRFRACFKQGVPWQSGQWAFWPTFQTFMRNYCITSYLNTLTVC